MADLTRLTQLSSIHPTDPAASQSTHLPVSISQSAGLSYQYPFHSPTSQKVQIAATNVSSNAEKNSFSESHSINANPKFPARLAASITKVSARVMKGIHLNKKTSPQSQPTPMGITHSLPPLIQQKLNLLNHETQLKTAEQKKEVNDVLDLLIQESTSSKTPSSLKTLELTLTHLLAGPQKNLIKHSTSLSAKVTLLKQNIQLAKLLGNHSETIHEVRNMIETNKDKWKKEKNFILQHESGVSICYNSATKGIFVIKEQDRGEFNKISAGFNWNSNEEVVLRQRITGSDARAEEKYQLSSKLSKLGVPGIIKDYQRVLLPEKQEGLLMEKMKGKELGKLLMEGKPLTPYQQLQIAQGLIQTVAAMHAANITHGDIAPQNLFVDLAQHPVKTTLFDFDQATDFGRMEHAAALQKKDDCHNIGILLHAVLTGKELSDREIKRAFKEPFQTESLEHICWELVNHPGETPLASVFQRLKAL
jgi:tRNA A-37 threonylcarbamoyl transferase component Bud32